MERILADVEKLCFDKELFPIIDKVEKGERLTFEDGMTVMGTEDLNTVGMLADYVKRQRVGDKVYFVVNRHVNPSNICAISCRFCAFGVTKKSANAYELSHEQILSMLSDDIREVHIVGGLHPDWNFQNYLEHSAAILGLGIGELNGWIGHTAEYIGYTSLVMFEPESGSVIVIIMNIFGVGEHVPTKVFREYAEILN